VNFLCARDLLEGISSLIEHVCVCVCVCLLITVMFADNTVCVVSFRAECVWHGFTHYRSGYDLWLRCRWFYLHYAGGHWAESGLSLTLRVQGERTGGRLSWGGRRSGCGLELLEASVCMNVLQCGFTCCEFPSVYIWACVRTMYTCLLDEVTRMKRIRLNV